MSPPPKGKPPDQYSWAQFAALMLGLGLAMCETCRGEGCLCEERTGLTREQAQKPQPRPEGRHVVISNDAPLITANSDQFIEFLHEDWSEELYGDGGMLTFKATHPKWSFAKLDEMGYVTEVAEKQPISDTATVGVYYWGKGSDYVKYAEQMIEKDIRVNNEFYVCPVFNEAIQDGKQIKTIPIKKMWGLGTPEDLRYFLTYYKG